MILRKLALGIHCTDNADRRNPALRILLSAAKLSDDLWLVHIATPPSAPSPSRSAYDAINFDSCAPRTDSRFQSWTVVENEPGANILPPGVLTWLTRRPVIESRRLPELVSSQLRYVAEPRTWCRMAPFAEK